MIVFADVGRVEVVNVARPLPLRGALPSVPPWSLKVTVPVGTLAPGARALIVTERVIACSWTEASTEEVTPEVVVPALLTM